MALLLNIETSARICSVSISQSGTVLATQEEEAPQSHGERIIPLVQHLMKKCNVDVSDLEGVALSKGPGSYTGLRIGASTAKGICYAREIPLIAISTLESLTKGFLQYLKNKNWWQKKDIAIQQTRFIPVLKARKKEVYTAVYNHSLSLQQSPKAQTIDTSFFQSFNEEHTLLLFGPGLAAYQSSSIFPQNVISFPHFFPSAAHLPSLAKEKFNKEQFEDIAYFVPLYLKDLIIHP